MRAEKARESLIALLQLAYSGELAAALAYAGHWRATRDAAARARIEAIEREELHHRKCVGEMLSGLGSAPDPAREQRARVIGTTLGSLCRFTGNLAPLWGAGRLERQNIVEYENAARFAHHAELRHLVHDLLTMAEVEWEHERFFREELMRDPIGRRLPIWPQPPPKEEIRASFARALEHEHSTHAAIQLTNTGASV